MARPRDFDELKVLDAAIDRFWNFGYGATSVRDLGDAMGLGPTSLYNAFGDKNALFARCLDRYLDNTLRERIGRAQGTDSPRAAIESFINDFVEESLVDPRGCMLVNAALEVAPHDLDIHDFVAARLGELEDFLTRRIADGQHDGSIATTYPAESVARLLVTTILGLRVLARSRPEPALLRGAARQALALLDPPPPTR
jgi:TetR/AcrR family transcriptional repressor of nem operon